MTAQPGVIPSPAHWQGSAELHPYFVCDVFTSEPLQGNQLGVFVDGRPFTAAQMQRLARHGRIGFGEQIEIRQGAEIGRPSVLYARVTGESDRIDSVEVGGSALIVAEGRFRATLA
jgi:predicted PhzF superfamily epimerase YddE/YHI9